MKKLFIATLAVVIFVACAKNDSNSGGAPVKGSNKQQTPTNQQQLPGQQPNADKTKKDKTATDDAANNDGASNPSSTAVKVAKDSVVLALSKKMDVLNAASDEAKTANDKAANAVLSIESKIDSKTDEFSVVVTGKDSKQQILGGIIKDQKSDLQPAEDQTLMTGKFVCVDKDGLQNKTCKVATLDLKPNDKAGEVMAVVRHTNAILSVNDEKNPTDASPDYKKLKEFFVSSATNSTASSNIRTVFFNSSEVIHGTSFIRISMVTNDNQVIGLAGELKVAAAGMSFTEGSLTKSILPDAIISMIDDEKKIKTDLQDLIQSAQILKVENASDFNLLIDVKGNDSDSRQTISLKLTRDNPAVNDLN